MNMSTIQALEFSLVPGNAERLERYSERNGNMAWNGFARSIKYARNAFYISFALTSIAAIGNSFFSGEENKGSLEVCRLLTVLGVGCSSLLGKKLYDASITLRDAVQLLEVNRPNFLMPSLMKRGID